MTDMVDSFNVGKLEFKFNKSLGSYGYEGRVNGTLIDISVYTYFISVHEIAWVAQFKTLSVPMRTPKEAVIRLLEFIKIEAQTYLALVDLGS